MHRIPEYIALFVGVLAVQVLLLEHLNLGVYAHPLIYVAFVVLLPMEMRGVWVLLLGLATGLAVDALSAGMGLNTIAMMAAAFSRRGVLILMLGRETVGDGGTPCVARIGTAKYMRYSTAMVLIHTTVYFLFEAFSLGALHITVAKIVATTIVTAFLIYIVQLFFRK